MGVAVKGAPKVPLSTLMAAGVTQRYKYDTIMKNYTRDLYPTSACITGGF